MRNEAGEALTSWLGHVSPPSRPVCRQPYRAWYAIADVETRKTRERRERRVYAIVGEPRGPPGLHGQPAMPCMLAAATQS